MKILFSGGGTLGSVTPLLSINTILRDKNTEIETIWVGTKTGPERPLVESNGIKYLAIPSGKLRRYGSLQNVFDIFRFIAGFCKSLFIFFKERPNVCVSAGGFVSVPVHLAAFVFRVPTWIHQQDVNVGLANKLMAPIASVITTSLQKSVKDFSHKKNVHWIGTPVRFHPKAVNRLEVRKYFNLTSDLPIILALGGGTGSVRINEIILESLQYLEGKCEIIHLTGSGRPQEAAIRASEVFANYHPYPFLLEEIEIVYAISSIVVTRGGFGTISELAALGKPAIVIPKTGHQEENAKFFHDHGAVLYLNEKIGDGLILSKMILEALNEDDKMIEQSKILQSLLPPAKSEDVQKIFMLITKK